MLESKVFIYDNRIVFDRIMNQLVREVAVDIGYWAGAKKHPTEGVDMALVAIMNEYGTKLIPERSFMRNSIKENIDKINKYIEKLVDKIILGVLTWDIAIKRLAAYGMNIVKKKINDSRSWAVPLSDSTKKRKGSDQPLVDTGFLRRNIGWRKIRNKNKYRKGKF